MNMKTVMMVVLLALGLAAPHAGAQDRPSAPAAPKPGKLAPRPLYRDPPFDAPTDPVLCFNAEQHKWLMYYTARRATAPDATGVTWVHGSAIGVAESADGGATWTYRGTADIQYDKVAHPKDTTYWAPEVIWFGGLYHMYLAYVPGIFNDWNHPRQIVHLTSKDGMKWDTVGPLDLKSARVIDACVIQLPGGTWRMWYKDETKPRPLSYADSTDLYNWEPKGTAITEVSGEGPKVIHWQGKYWLIADCWANGMRVWSSDDCLTWKPQEKPLFGSHGDVVISGGRAWWFYFGGPRAASSGAPGARGPRGARAAGPLAQAGATSRTATAAPARRGGGRTTAINVVELSVTDGKLLAADPALPTTIDLKSEREEEK